jgi:translation initiation factor 2 alpha subunit (eIF-2alpha)
MVLRVDKEKGYIDLSKRRVAAEDIQVGSFRRRALGHILLPAYIIHVHTQAYSDSAVYSQLRKLLVCAVLPL